MSLRHACSAVLAIVVVCAAIPLSADELGRLFLAPTERAALDRARYEASASAATPAPAAPPTARIEAPAEPQVPLPAITVDGFVQRSDGPPTVWINGIDSYQGNLAGLGIEARDLALREDGVRVPLAGTDETPVLKPGQSFDPARARVIEGWEPPAPPALALPADLGLEAGEP
ncbi:MAG: hypothetical protein RLW61_15405 [Gammaproteobacteria bacterium]